MAAADDDLADMASGEDELADMASGQDELARMASGGKATLAEQVEAELTGAKVTFDGSEPVIEAPEVSVANPGVGEPDVVEHVPPSGSEIVDPPAPEPSAPVVHTIPMAPSPSEALSRSQPAAPSTGATRQKDQAPAIDWVNPGGTGNRGRSASTFGAPASSPDPAAKQVAITRAALTGCLPFVLIFSVAVFIFRGGNAGSTFFGILIIAGLFYLLLKVAGATSRRTTDMPLDDLFNSKRKR